jgi:hypothetical protein
MILFQVMTNALWYVTNHHATFQDAARRLHVTPIPEAFKDYQEYNNEKRKKKKMSSLNAKELESHSQALFSLLLKPVMKSSPAFIKLHDDIQSLAECFHNYSQHLEVQSKKIAFNQSLPHPVRTVGEHTTAEHRKKTSDVKQKYLLLDKEISETNEPVFFDENRHIEKNFQNNMQRFRFFEELQLSVPVDIYRFCPGGSVLTTVCIQKVSEHRGLPQMLTDAARVVMKNKDKFQEFHTRYQKRMLKKN